MELVRAAKKHVAALRKFECASEAPYEREVEEYVRVHVAEHLHRGVLLLVDGDDLVAVGEHEPQLDPYGTGRLVTYLKALAVARRWQGRRAGGIAVATLGLSALIHDALRTDREPLVTALIDKDNERAQRLVARQPFEFREVPPRVRGQRRGGGPATYLFFERRFQVW